MTTPLEQIQAHPRGARFYRADLHVHSFGASHDVKDATMTPQAIVDTAVQEGLGLVAITDHNEISNVGLAIAAAMGKPVMIVPAVELSTPQGHLLCYLPSLDALQKFHGRLDIVDRGTEKSRCQNAVLDALGFLVELGGFAILAHVDTDGGFEQQVSGSSPHKVDVLCHPALLGIELKSASCDIRYSEADPNAERAQMGKARIERLGLGTKQFLARVLNSDSHTLKGLGHNAKGDRRVTRIKMDAPSFHSLRLALEDSDARVRLEDQIPTGVPHIVGAYLEGGFLDGQALHFSQNLNCIIGGRGTGKSTTFEAVRCLHGEPSGSGLIDSEIWPATLHLVWQDAAGQCHDLFRTLGGSVENANDPLNGPVEFAMDCFGQGETARISFEAKSNPLALLEYLDRFVDISDWVTAEDEARAKLLELQSEIEKAAQNVEQIPQHERALAVTRQQLATLEKAKAKDIIELQRRVADEKAVRDGIVTKVSEVKSSLSRGAAKMATQQLRELADPAQLHLGVAEFNSILASTSNLEGIIGKAEGDMVVAFGTFSAAVQAQLQLWKAKDAEAAKAIEAKRKELESQNVKLDMAYIQKLATDEATHQQNVTNLKTWIPHLAELRRQRQEVLNTRWAARAKIAGIRDAYARSASKVLQASLGDLVVSLKFVANAASPDAADIIVQTMGWKTVQVPRASLLVEQLTVPALLQAVEKKNKAAITALTTVEGVRPFNNSDAALIIDRLAQPHVRFALERCEIQDLPRLTVTKAFVDGSGKHRYATREFAKLSLGQQQSVLLALMLSANSNQPLIIDQPEDNLDGEFIYHSLVPVLRRAKERRQIIIVTHNANIAVLGDAEQIFVLKSSSDAGRIVVRGSIDHQGTRDAACIILEGAKEAFQRRARTYGFALQSNSSV